MQILLLNYGILSTQRKQAKDIINLEIRGKSAAMFQQEIIPLRPVLSRRQECPYFRFGTIREPIRIPFTHGNLPLLMESPG